MGPDQDGPGSMTSLEKGERGTFLCWSGDLSRVWSVGCRGAAVKVASKAAVGRV